VLGGPKLSNFKTGGPKLQKVKNKGTKTTIKQKKNNVSLLRKDSKYTRVPFESLPIILVFL
jgi:hypothetical protein